MASFAYYRGTWLPVGLSCMGWDPMWARTTWSSTHLCISFATTFLTHATTFDLRGRDLHINRSPYPFGAATRRERIWYGQSHGTWPDVDSGYCTLAYHADVVNGYRKAQHNSAHTPADAPHPLTVLWQHQQARAVARPRRTHLRPRSTRLSMESKHSDPSVSALFCFFVKD